MVHHYKSKQNKYVLELENHKVVEFLGNEFTTDNDETATLVESSGAFKNGTISFSDGIKKANKSNVHSGARATTE